MTNVDDPNQQIDLRIKLLERDISNALDRIKNAYETETNQQRINRSLIAIIGGLIGLACGGGLWNFNSRLDDFKSNVENRISNIEHSSLVNSASVEAIGSNSGNIIASPAISRNFIDGNIPVYSLIFEFNANVLVTGTVTGQLVGYFIKYDSEYADVIAPQNNPVERSVLINGEVLYFDSPRHVSEGYPSHITWNTVIVRKNCRELDDILNSLRRRKSAGTLQLAPVLEQIKQKPEHSLFSIQIGPYNGINDCSDFKD